MFLRTRSSSDAYSWTVALGISEEVEQLGLKGSKKKKSKTEKRKTEKRKTESNTTVGVSPIACRIVVNGRLCGVELPHNLTSLNAHLGQHEKMGELPHNISLCPFARVPGKKACTSNEGRSKLSVFARHVHSMHFLNVPRVLCDLCGADYARGDEIARHTCSGAKGTSVKDRPRNRPQKKRKLG